MHKLRMTSILSNIFAQLHCNLPRLRCTDSYRKIGYHFGVSKQTATRIKWRVQGYMLYKNSLGSLPSHVTSHGLTEDQVLWLPSCTSSVHTMLQIHRSYLA